MIALLVIACLYVIISNAVVKSQERRRTQRVAEEYVTGTLATESGEPSADVPNSESPAQTPEEKLKRLKNMKDEGLITDEEYEQKKAEVMKDF